MGTFLAGHVEEAFGWPVRAGAEQAAGGCRAHAPVEGGLVGLGKVQLPVGGKGGGAEAASSARAYRPISSQPARGGEAACSDCPLVGVGRGWHKGADPSLSSIRSCLKKGSMASRLDCRT